MGINLKEKAGENLIVSAAEGEAMQIRTSFALHRNFIHKENMFWTNVPQFNFFY